MDPCVRIITPGPFSRHLDPLDIAHSTYIEKCPPSLIDIVHDLYMPSNYIFFFGTQKKIRWNCARDHLQSFRIFRLSICVCLCVDVRIQFQSTVNWNIMKSSYTWKSDEWDRYCLKFHEMSSISLASCPLAFVKNLSASTPPLSLSLSCGGGGLVICLSCFAHTYIYKYTHAHTPWFNSKIVPKFLFFQPPPQTWILFPFINSDLSTNLFLGLPFKASRARDPQYLRTTVPSRWCRKLHSRII